MSRRPPLGGAIIGFGQVAEHGHWPAFAASSDFHIAAIVEGTPERRALAAGLVPGARVVESLDDLAVGEIDFIDICTPPALHAEPLLAALERGWHVLCEKPVLLDPETLAIARAAADASCRALVPVHNWKYAPIVRRATTLVRNGIIGTLRHVSIETLRIRECTRSSADRPNWRRNPAIAGGGILMDHGWHAVYLALQWFGERPLTAQAELDRTAPDGVEDEARLVVSFPSGDATIMLSWNADVRRNTIVLGGDRGELILADDTLVVRANATEERFAFSSALSTGSYHAEWFVDMLPDVARAFDNPAASRAGLDEAADCLKVILWAYQADAASSGTARGISAG